VNPIVTAGVEELYIQDNYKPAPWLTLNAGERRTHFSGAIAENAIYPRLGIALQIPKLNWSFAPSTATSTSRRRSPASTGPALAYAQSNGDSYVPLKGERNEEHQFGLQIPSAAGCSTPTPSRPRPRTFSTTTTSGIQYLHPHHRPGRAGAGVGVDPALAASLALRPGPPVVFQPDRAADRRHHRRPRLLRPVGSSACQPAPGYSALITISATPSTSASTEACPTA